MKSILKEVIIILLLAIAVILLMCVIFYNYIPINKTVPSDVEAYVTSNTIKDEINEEIVEYPKQNIVFEITDSDLSLYRLTQSYDQGKSNPFASESSKPSDSQINTNTNNDGNNGSSGGTGTTNNTSGTFFEDTPLK